MGVSALFSPAIGTAGLLKSGNQGRWLPILLTICVAGAAEAFERRAWAHFALFSASGPARASFAAVGEMKQSRQLCLPEFSGLAALCRTSWVGGEPKRLGAV